MNKEDMIRMIESGEKLPDYCQEEIDKLLFKEIKGEYGKVIKQRVRRMFTDVSKSHRMGLARSYASSRTIGSDNNIQRPKSNRKIHSSSIRKK